MVAQPTRIKTRAEEALAANFAAWPTDDPNYETRAAAFDVLNDRGLPHRRVEDWKYTDLRALMRDAPAPAGPAEPAAARTALARADLFEGIDRARIVFVNGFFVPTLSDMSGLQDSVDFASLGRFLADGGAMLDRFMDPAEAPILALNSAFVGDGAVLRIRDGAKLTRPIEVVSVFAGDVPGLQTLRHQIAVGAGAEATVLLTYSGPGGIAYQTNAVTEIGIGDGAKLRLITAQEEGDEALHLSLTRSRIGAGAVFDPFNFMAGGLVARSELRISFDGEGSSAGIRGATIAAGRQHIDTTLLVDHAVPGCSSQEYFKAALDGEAQGVFQGKIIVRQHAQKTDAKMMSRALLLSEGAEFSNKPELEIFADDVTCGHGATCGQIDEEMLFFLRSRGIAKADAERLLIQAFLAEAIELIGDEAIERALEAHGPLARDGSGPPLMPVNGSYDVETIRADFPILSRTVHGKPLIYLDNGASAQKPRAVLDAVTKAYTEEYANVHRGLHFLSNAATEAYEAARETVREFLNAPSADEIVFTKSSTEAINLVAQSFGGARIGEGDEIVISILEHHSNIVPWHFHRERNGAVLKWSPVHEDGSFDLEAFERLLTERTKMVSIVHMSNVTGTVVPIKEVCRIAHERGIPVLVDGSQSAVHLPVDVQDLGCDFFVFTGHKTYGPTGIGVLWGKAEHLRSMQPFLGGGEMIRDVTEHTVTYGEPPMRFEAGTPPIVQAIGLAAALRYMQGLGREAIHAHESDLALYAQEQLSALNYIRIFGHATGKGAIMAFEMEGAHAHDVSTIIDREGIAVRAGTHCAQPLLARYGVTSTCRASFGLYNTRAEVDALVRALAKAHSFFS